MYAKITRLSEREAVVLREVDRLIVHWAQQAAIYKYTDDRRDVCVSAHRDFAELRELMLTGEYNDEGE